MPNNLNHPQYQEVDINIYFICGRFHNQYQKGQRSNLGVYVPFNSDHLEAMKKP